MNSFIFIDSFSLFALNSISQKVKKETAGTQNLSPCRLVLYLNLMNGKIFLFTIILIRTGGVTDPSASTASAAAVGTRGMTR